MTLQGEAADLQRPRACVTAPMSTACGAQEHSLIATTIGMMMAVTMSLSMNPTMRLT
jgi:hypothetical protein